jgi:hypothetical protein
VRCYLGGGVHSFLFGFSSAMALVVNLASNRVTDYGGELVATLCEDSRSLVAFLLQDNFVCGLSTSAAPLSLSPSHTFAQSNCSIE